MSRQAKQLVSAGAFLIVFTLCVFPSGQPGTTQKANLSVYIYAPNYLEQAEQQSRMFAEKNPDINVNFIAMTGGSVMECLQLKIAAKALPDVVSMNADGFGYKLADEGLLLDVGNTGDWDRMIDSMKAVWTSTQKGVKFGISGGLALSVLYMNLDMLKGYGINPDIRNWDEFIQACARIKSDGKTPVIVQGSHPNTLYNTFFTYAVTEGVTRDNPKNFVSGTRDGTVKYDTPDFVKNVGKAVYLKDKGYFQDGYMGCSQDAAVTEFVNGGGAFIFAGSWMAGPLSQGKFDLGITWAPFNDAGTQKIPVSSSETGWSISAETQNKSAALKYLKFMCNGEGYKLYQNFRQCIPPFKASTIDVPVVLPPPMKSVLDYMEKAPLQGLLVFVLLPSPTMEPIKKNLQELLMGTMTAEKFSSDVQNLLVTYKGQ